MENKCIKKSSLKQLQVLVEYMEANPEFARGSCVFGSSKVSMEEQWVKLTKRLNASGPPVRTIAEWKKTWTDLKSRTKKKIAENKKSLCETGGGLYRVNPLSEVEQIVDRTLFLSKAAAPSGKVFGFVAAASSEACCSMESGFTPLPDTPPRSSRVIAVVTPSRQQNKEIQQPTQQLADHSRQLEEKEENNDIPKFSYTRKKRKPPAEENFDDCLPNCSSSKKRKTTAGEQISLIRRQIRVGEESAAIAKENSNATVMLAEATKALADAAKKIADAAEIQATAAKRNTEIQQELLIALQTIAMALVEKN